MVSAALKVVPVFVRFLRDEEQQLRAQGGLSEREHWWFVQQQLHAYAAAEEYGEETHRWVMKGP